MQTVALGVLPDQTTHDALWLGLLTVCAWDAALIGAPLGGVIADRVVRQRWIQANNLVMALSASALGDGRIDPPSFAPVGVLPRHRRRLCSSASWAAWQSLFAGPRRP